MGTEGGRPLQPRSSGFVTHESTRLFSPLFLVCSSGAGDSEPQKFR